jgi:hypothetical protein
MMFNLIRKKLMLFAMAVAISFTGCSLAHYLSIGKRSVETASGYDRFLCDLKADTGFSFQLKAGYLDSLSTSRNFCLNLYKFDRGAAASMVQIRMYDRLGRLASGWEHCYSDLWHYDLFDSVPMRRIRHHPTNYDLTLLNDLGMISMDSATRQKTLSEIRSHDYTILLLYSVSMGWYSKDAIKKCSRYVKHNTGIAMIFCNTSGR